MKDNQISWEQAVSNLRSDETQQQLVNDCYFDLPLTKAALRFEQSEEWQETKKILAKNLPGKILDIGSGNGIASFAFARIGCETYALEPDSSQTVGAGAIKTLATENELEIKVVETFGESLPFDDNFFDVVYCRQVLHHARDLELLCKESFRVLKTGGLFLATREHVINTENDLQVFLQNHPLHSLYGGENAYQLPVYKHAIMNAGLELIKVWGPHDTAINYYPIKTSDMKDRLSIKLSKFIPGNIAQKLIDNPFILGILRRGMTQVDNTPGRLYSFLAIKNK